MPKQSAKPKELMSTQVLLASSGLAEFYKYFEQAGHGMFDALTHINDLKVEQIVLEVEARCGITFNSAVRIRIWKALRFQWFRGPGHSLPFIERTEIPNLILPPLDWIEQDSRFKFSDLESDRQRQVMRKIKQMAPGESGQALQTFQFEVYKRSIDLIYEFRDLERCVQEWERRNPRNMIQEDMREEVMRMRLKGIIDLANASIAVRKNKSLQLKRYSTTLVVVQVISLALCGVMLLNTFAALSGTPPELLFSFFVSSKQFISAIAFFTSSVFASVVAERRRGDPLIRELKKTTLNCERLIERISDFRIQTEELRMAKSEARQALVPISALTFGQTDKVEEEPKPEPSQAKPKEAEAKGETEQGENDQKVRQRPGAQKKKKKKEKDKALALWAPDAGKMDSHEIAVMQKQLAQSYKHLEALPADFRRPGNDRMWGFQDRLGGVKEDDLCVKMTTGNKHWQKKRNAYVETVKAKALAAIPKNAPPSMLAIQAGIGQSSSSSSSSIVQAQTIGREERSQATLPVAPPAPPDARTFYFHPPRKEKSWEEEQRPLLQVADGGNLRAAAAEQGTAPGASSSSSTGAGPSQPQVEASSSEAVAASRLSPFVPGGERPDLEEPE